MFQSDVKKIKEYDFCSESQICTSSTQSLVSHSTDSSRLCSDGLAEEKSLDYCITLFAVDFYSPPLIKWKQRLSEWIKFQSPSSVASDATFKFFCLNSITAEKEIRH